MTFFEKPEKHRKHEKFSAHFDISRDPKDPKWAKGQKWEALVAQGIVEIKHAFEVHDYDTAFLAIVRNFGLHTEKPESKAAEHFRQGLDEMLSHHAKELLEAARYDDFVSFIDDLSTKKIKLFTAEDFRQIPGDMMHAAGLVDAVKQKLIRRTEHYGPVGFTEAFDRFSDLGIIPPEDMCRIQEVRASAERDLIGRMPYVESFVIERDLWAHTGVITAQEANAFPEVIRGAKDDIIKNSNDPRRKKLWIEAGVLTAEEADALIGQS